MPVSWTKVQDFSSFQSSPQPKDLIFQDREHTFCEHNEAIFNRLYVQMGSNIVLLINIHFGDTLWADEKFLTA